MSSESDALDKLIKQYSKRTCTSLKDAEIEIQKIVSKALKKFKYHSVNVDNKKSQSGNLVDLLINQTLIL